MQRQTYNIRNDSILFWVEMRAALMSTAEDKWGPTTASVALCLPAWERWKQGILPRCFFEPLIVMITGYSLLWLPTIIEDKITIFRSDQKLLLMVELRKLVSHLSRGPWLITNKCMKSQTLPENPGVMNQNKNLIHHWKAFIQSSVQMAGHWVLDSQR